MESINKGREEALPVGYRFKPTDEELITFYLRNKVLGNPLPYDLITEPQVYDIEPWKLTVVTANIGNYSRGDKEVFFFARRTVKYPNGKRPNRSAGGGFWKATTADKKILSPDQQGVNQQIGAKRSLAYFQGKPTEATKTDWIMHEYTLCETSSLKQFDEWAVCRMMCGRNNSKIMNSEILLNGATRSSCVPPALALPSSTNKGEAQASSYQAGCSDSMPSPLQSSYPVLEIPKKPEDVSQLNLSEGQLNIFLHNTAKEIEARGIEDPLDGFLMEYLDKLMTDVAADYKKDEQELPSNKDPVDEFLVDDPDLYLADDPDS